jgi:hypothetical protein
MTPPAATAAGRTIPRTAVPRRPRRVSGPARTTRRAPAAEPLALRAFTRVVTLADSRLLRRLVHGRLWIPLVAAGLMGIVFMQVSMLKLNAGIGRAVQSASTLERQNAAMRADVSRMESGEKIDDVAHNLGMVVPADGGEHYVTAGRGEAERAVQRMTAPTSTTTVSAAATTASQTPAQAEAQAPAQPQTTTQTPAATQATTMPAQTATASAPQPAPAPQQAATQQPAAVQAPAAATPPAQAAAAPSGGVAAPAANGQG